MKKVKKFTKAVTIKNENTGNKVIIHTSMNIYKIAKLIEKMNQGCIQ